jgi:hypothetical protein
LGRPWPLLIIGTGIVSTRGYRNNRKSSIGARGQVQISIDFMVVSGSL